MKTGFGIAFLLLSCHGWAQDACTLIRLAALEQNRWIFPTLSDSRIRSELELTGTVSDIRVLNATMEREPVVVDPNPDLEKPQPAVANNPIALAAVEMASRTWVKLPAATFYDRAGAQISARRFFISDTGHCCTLYWNDSGSYDPLTDTVIVVGDASGQQPNAGHVHIYDVATHSWRWGPEPTDGTIGGHGYDHNTECGEGYACYIRNGGGSVFRLDIAHGRWADLGHGPERTAGTVHALTYMPGKGLIHIHPHLLPTRFELWTPEGGWSAINVPNNELKNLSNHIFAEYLPVHDVVIFGGGNDFPTTVWTLNRNFVLSKPIKAPMRLRASETVEAEDPVSGDLITVGGTNRGMYSYNPTTNEWEDLSATGQPFKDLGSGMIAASLSKYGVILYLRFDNRNADMWLYKHKERL